MSAIASFYLLGDDKREGVTAAAMSRAKALKKKRFGFLPPKLPLNPDPFREFMGKHARELDDFPFSGYLLLDVELLAPGALGSKDEVGSELSRLVGSTFVSFRREDATRVTALLETADFSEGTIRTYLGEEGREGEFPAIVAPIHQSVEHLLKWLREVGQGHTGILSIG